MFTRRYTNFWDGLFRPSKTHILGSGEVKTLTNLVSNGNFVDATGWVRENASQSVASNEISITASAQYGYTTQIISADGVDYRNHVVFFSAWIKATHTSVALICNDGKSQLIVYPTVTGEYQYVSGLYTIQPDATKLIILLMDRSSGSFVSQKIKYVTCVDLTAAFGAGNEPTTGEIENWIATQSNSWFDTTAQYLANTNEWF
jgi:hypothetical protein